ncbi:MAG: hypothetical protein ACXWQ6_11075 [Candidatus Limnocylindrales bacterium]
MNDAWGWWLFFVGLAVGVAGYALVRGTLSRTEADEAADERANEAAWISRTIEAWGGEAPAELVAQVLDLHGQYLAGDGFLAPDEPPAEALSAPEPGHAPEAVSAPEAGHTPDVERDDTRGEAAEAHLGQAG